MRNSCVAPLGAALLIAMTPLNGIAADDPPADDPAMEQFRVIDANGDGFLSESELSDFQRKVFRTLDEDADGQFSLDQFIDVVKRRGAETGTDADEQARIEARWVARFTGVDTNGDGIITVDEFEMSHSRRFRSKDADGDGFLSWEELDGGL